MENRKIISIEVENLFNIYNHKINLKDGGITIIYGPNGVGKTILLSMVHAFFSKNFSVFDLFVVFDKLFRDSPSRRHLDGKGIMN